MNILKNTIVTLFSAIIAFLQPVQNAVYLLLFLFVINLIFGVFHDIIINSKRFSFKKFIWASAEFLIYTGIVCAIYVIGHFQNDIIEAQYIIKIISYLFIYAYSTNVLKNLLLIRPDNMVFKFMYHVLSLAFIKRIPYLSDFLKQNENETN